MFNKFKKRGLNQIAQRYKEDSGNIRTLQDYGKDLEGEQLERHIRDTQIVHLYVTTDITMSELGRRNGVETETVRLIINKYLRLYDKLNG